jgi:hypothetical protein
MNAQSGEWDQSNETNIMAMARLGFSLHPKRAIIAVDDVLDGTEEESRRKRVVTMPVLEGTILGLYRLS